MPVLWRASLNHLLRHGWQLALSVLGVALGVAVIVAVDLAIGSAHRAFALSIEAVTGRATHQVTGGPAGLPEQAYRKVRVGLGLDSVAPVVEGYVTWARSAPTAAAPRTFRLLGVDPFAEGDFRPYLGRPGARAVDLAALLTRPGAVLLATSTAHDAGLAPGDSFAVHVNGHDKTLVVAGLLEPANEVSRRALENLLVTDIATAQEVLGELGRLDRIELIVSEGDGGAARLRAIQRALPPGAVLERTAARTEATRQMTRAFSLNLKALGLLTLVFGMFLIYNSTAFSVVQRRALFGTLRALGVTRREVFGVVMGEAFAIGIAATALGLLAGIALGQGLVRLVTTTINDLYFAVNVREFTIAPLTLARVGLLGVGATVLAAAVPAWEATTATPRAALVRSDLEEKVRRAAVPAGAAGTLVVFGGCVLLMAPSQSMVASFAGILAIILGAALLVPAATLLVMRMARPAAGALGGVLGRLAARNVAASLSRTAPAIAALAIALSVGVAVGIMIGSFRSTVVDWLETTLQADVYVSVPGGGGRLATGPELDPDLVARLAVAPSVAGVTTYRRTTVASPLGPTRLVALDLHARHRRAFRFKEIAETPWVGSASRVGHAPRAQAGAQTRRSGDAPPGAARVRIPRAAVQDSPLPFSDGAKASDAWAAFDAGALLASEPFAYRHGLDAGDTVRLVTDRGLRAFPVAGVFYDYSSDQGVVFLDRRTYNALWDDPAVSSLAVFAAAGASPDTLVRTLRRLADQGQGVLIRSNRGLREASLAVFDRTFTITAVLRVLALVVAFVGVLSALFALELERARELAVLRATGMTPGQVWRLVSSQTALMGAAAGVLAVPLGLMLAAAMVFVVNKRSFGWTLQWQVDPSILLQAVGLAIVAAVLAGVYPAWRMARTRPALALRGE